MRFPVKKHNRVLTNASAGTSVNEAMGKVGLTVNAGRPPQNWKMERRKR